MDPALVYDPNAMGAQTQFAPRPQPTVNTQQPGLDDNWSRIMQAAKAGLISPQQMEMLKKQLGYDQPQQAQQPSNIGGQLGQTLGQTVGRVGQSVNKQLQTSPGGEEARGMPRRPELEQQIARPGVNIPDDQQNKAYIEPSPQWNQ